MFHYRISPDNEVPIYRQLVDQINAQIRSGALKTGTQLPTVREMAAKLQLSCGTVKHVYDCLQEMGVIEMTRRRGTFVKYVRPDTDSRKQQAMQAIDAMIRKLTALNFSPAEIQIFLNLKMREWGMTWSGVRITLVTEYDEFSAVLTSQLNRIPNTQITVYPLRQLQEYPYIVDEQSDVILASVEDGQKLSLLLPDNSKLIRIALAPPADSLVSLASLQGECIGVVCQSQAFFGLVKAAAPDALKPRLVPIMEDTQALHRCDGLVIVPGFPCSPAVQARVEALQPTGGICQFLCQLDEGSMLYLEERISKLRDERQLWPSALRL